MKELVYLLPEQLEHHPDNPRKAIGDIEELTASIKIDGILQNLTVVPKPNENNKYLIVIGNRRYEAGCAAHLDKFPCVISDMDYTKQLETMLVENINRSDLSILEEAEGFNQLLLNGFSVDDVAAKTGFSSSTIKKRVKLLIYKKKNVEEAIERGATLEQFAKLEKIKKKSEKEKLIKYIGTEDFNYEYKNIIRSQNEQRNKKLIEALLEKTDYIKLSDKESWSSKYEREYNQKSIDLREQEYSIDELKGMLNPKGKHQHYYAYYYGELVWYKLRPKKKASNAELTDKEIYIKNKQKEIKKINQSFFELRNAFVEELIDRKNIKDWRTICIDSIMSVSLTASNDYNGYCMIHPLKDDVFEKLGVGFEVYAYDLIERQKRNAAFIEKYAEREAGIFVYLTYQSFSDNINLCCHEQYANNFPDYKQNLKLQAIYEFLIRLGYQISNAEQEYLNGTHQIFTNEYKEAAE